MSACGPLLTGTWLDDPPSLTLAPEYLDRLRALNLEHVAVMVDGSKPGLDDQRWETAHLAQLAASLPGWRRIVSLWPTPSRAHLEDVRDALPALLAALGSKTVELDVEPAGGWRSRDLEGFVGLADAGRTWVEMARDAGAERVEVTTFPAAIPVAAGAIAAADVLALQVYPVSSRDGKPVAYAGKLGPKRWPREALEAARKRFPGVELVCGLPAYRQSWPGVRPEHAMGQAIASAVSVGCNNFRWWSAKHAVRLGARKYAAAVIAGVRS